MFGCFIMLFARKDVMADTKLKFFQAVKIKTGVKGIAANKGGVALRFNYLDSSFVFMNSHLTSGQNKVKERFLDCRKCFTSACEFFHVNEASISEEFLGLTSTNSRH